VSFSPEATSFGVAFANHPKSLSKSFSQAIHVQWFPFPLGGGFAEEGVQFRTPLRISQQAFPLLFILTSEEEAGEVGNLGLSNIRKSLTNAKKTAIFAKIFSWSGAQLLSEPSSHEALISGTGGFKAARRIDAGSVATCTRDACVTTTGCRRLQTPSQLRRRIRFQKQTVIGYNGPQL